MTTVGPRLPPLSPSREEFRSLTLENFLALPLLRAA